MLPSARRASGAAWSEPTPAPSRILPLRVRSPARVLTAPSAPWSEPTPAPSRILLARVGSLPPAPTAPSADWAKAPVAPAPRPTPARYSQHRHPASPGRSLLRVATGAGAGHQ